MKLTNYCHFLMKGRTFFPFDSNRRKRVFIILLSMSWVVLLLSGLAYACRKTRYMKGLGNTNGSFSAFSKSYIFSSLERRFIHILLTNHIAYVRSYINQTYFTVGNWGGERHRSLKMEHLDDLQFFSLRKVARATDNFSVSNKIGEGGFGPVYKVTS